MARELTHTQKAKFLACLSIGLSVTEAAKQSGVNRRTLYYWKAEDESFSDAWADAKTASIEELEDHLRKRATDPNDKASHLLLMFLLKKLDPTYRDSFKTETKREITATREFVFEPEEIEAAKIILDSAKAKRAPDQP